MKYFVFILFAMVAAPITAVLSSMSPLLRGLGVMALVFSPAIGDMANINFLSMEEYRGPDRGFEIALTDILTLGFFGYLLMHHSNRLLWWPLGSTPLLILYLIGMASGMTSADPLIASFTLFKGLRLYFLFWVIANLIHTGTDIAWVRRGWIFLGLLGTMVVLKQKYLDGIYRVSMFFDHSNTVPLYLNLVCPILMVWGLADRSLGKKEKILCMIAGLGMAGCVTMTFSRAGTALAACAVAGAIFVGVIRNPRASSFITAGVLGFIGLLGIAAVADAFIDRILNAPESSAEARDEFNVAAEQMTNEYPIGVGPNMFSHTLTNVGKYREHLHVMKGEEQGGVAHHIYWLTSAEFGWVGLAVFILLLARWNIAAIWHGWGDKTPEGLAMTGVAIGYVAVHLSGFLEWALRITPVSQQVALASGMLAGCVSLRKRQKKEEKRARVLALNEQRNPESQPAMVA